MRLRNVLYHFLGVFALLTACNRTSEAEKYDKETGQQYIGTHEEIDEVLAGFDQMTFEDLPESYITYSDPFQQFSSKLKSHTYYVVRGREIFKFLLGKYRVADFLPADSYYKKNERNFDANYAQYWLIDKKVLHMLLDIIFELDRLGYDKYGFNVRESHRHPKLNKVRGGASKSQHIYGRAIDLVARDLNRDGKRNEKDKAILLEVAEKIVGKKGGVGRYPGTMTVHIDCRGYRARWDSY